MISARHYDEFLLPCEILMANNLRPYGIHHCGNNLQKFAELYAKVPAVFVDVGWGSDVARCRKIFPDAFLNLRLSPVRMLQQTPDEIRRDTEQLLLAGDLSDKIGLCCINMDYGTPDENIMALFNVAQNSNFITFSKYDELTIKKGVHAFLKVHK
jgi:hypothetical protein